MRRANTLRKPGSEARSDVNANKGQTRDYGRHQKRGETRGQALANVTTGDDDEAMLSARQTCERDEGPGAGDLIARRPVSGT